MVPCRMAKPYTEFVSRLKEAVSGRLADKPILTLPREMPYPRDIQDLPVIETF